MNPHRSMPAVVRPAAIGRTIKRRVVDDDWRTVTKDVDVSLNPGETSICSLFKSCKAVLGCDTVQTAVCKNATFHRSSLTSLSRMDKT